GPQAPQDPREGRAAVASTGIPRPVQAAGAAPVRLPVRVCRRRRRAVPSARDAGTSHPPVVAGRPGRPRERPRAVCAASPLRAQPPRLVVHARDATPLDRGDGDPTTDEAREVTAMTPARPRTYGWCHECGPAVSFTSEREQR